LYTDSARQIRAGFYGSYINLDIGLHNYIRKFSVSRLTKVNLEKAMYPSYSERRVENYPVLDRSIKKDRDQYIINNRH